MAKIAHLLYPDVKVPAKHLAEILKELPEDTEVIGMELERRYASVRIILTSSEFRDVPGGGIYQDLVVSVRAVKKDETRAVVPNWVKETWQEQLQGNPNLPACWANDNILRKHNEKTSKIGR